MQFPSYGSVNTGVFFNSFSNVDVAKYIVKYGPHIFYYNNDCNNLIPSLYLYLGRKCVKYTKLTSIEKEMAIC